VQKEKLQNSKYKSIFISDLHLGTPGCSADELCDFLKNNNCDRLYLVGDIVDGWALSKKAFWPQSHSNVVRRILTAAKRGTKVYWIVGNHDEVLRNWFDFRLQFGRIRILNEYVHLAINGKKYYVTHGDIFDPLMHSGKFLMYFGDFLYNWLMRLNRWVAFVRRKLRLPYWSLSAYLKAQTKETINMLYKYKETMVNHCKKKGYDGIICGHIHTPSIEVIDGIEYMNDGDWVESRTALVEHYDGKWELIYYKDE
jgi:UDP-2,3-diacylglucosamine pyrophosphatase LpxH|tara:strand:- start:125 stop:886 length:762 start_codon:yes stop_codon:yes gene_type:complete